MHGNINHLAHNIQKTSFKASKRPWKFRTRKTAEKITRKLPQWTIVLSQWNRWVAIDIHMDHDVCRILSILVAFHICYLLDHANVHAISALVTWFQCMSNIFSHYGDLDPLYISILHGDHDPMYIFIIDILIYLYCTRWWPHMSYSVSCLIMAIVLLCIRAATSACSYV